MNFATLQGLTIPEGVVTQITDASGRVLWMLSGGKVVLEVEKITSDTYAGETTYTAEEFILLNIYPKTNGTVSVTYGGLTKTISDTSGAAEPNAQEVFFGTFKGVSDSVTTPASGTLTIEGDYRGFSVGTYMMSNKSMGDTCPCITAITDMRGIEVLPVNAFKNCSALTSVDIPNGITSIGNYAFSSCTGLVSVDIPDGVTDIGIYAFNNCTSLTLNNLPSSVTNIGGFAFAGCIGLAYMDIPFGVTNIDTNAFEGCTNLVLASLPSRLVSIGNYAFKDCTSLSFTEIPSGVTSIGDYAFHMPALLDDDSEVNLTSLVLPSGVTSIGDLAFARAMGSSSSYLAYLESVEIKATTPPTLGANPFGTPSASNKPTIIVPRGYGDTYKAAEGWSNYASRIVEAS